MTDYHPAHPLNMYYCLARKKDTTSSILPICHFVHHTKNCTIKANGKHRWLSVGIRDGSIGGPRMALATPQVLQKKKFLENHPFLSVSLYSVSWLSVSLLCS